MMSAELSAPERFKLRCQQEAAADGVQDGMKALSVEQSQYERGWDAGHYEGYDSGYDFGYECGGGDMADALFIAVQELRDRLEKEGNDVAVAWLNKAEEAMEKSYQGYIDGDDDSGDEEEAAQ